MIGAAIALQLALAQSYTDETPVDGFPTGRELYAACQSYARHIQDPDTTRGPSGDTPPAYCGLLGIQAMMKFTDQDSQGPHICLPKIAGTSLAMTNAFLRFYERDPKLWANRDGRLVYVQAMLETFPCRSPGQPK